MKRIMMLILPALLLATVSVSAADIAGLAECATKVFTDINRTQKWSGKAPSGCAPGIAVEKRAAGLFVTAWANENVDGGWVRTAFSAGMGYAEIARKKELAAANHDILARARRIGRCLESINSDNDPLECRDRATKSYLVGEESGSESKRIVWLDDNGRHTVAEYSFGNTAATPTPPVDLFNGQQLPPGMIIDLHLRDDGRGGRGAPAGGDASNGSPGR